ncbi:MAG: hypothetical protein AcusKO_07210 [Acuticoccus sp.]
MGDTGSIVEVGVRFRVTDVAKAAERLYIHRGRWKRARSQSGRVMLEEDKGRARQDPRNHSAPTSARVPASDTGRPCRQKGSLVSPDRPAVRFRHTAPVSVETSPDRKDATAACAEIDRVGHAVMALGRGDALGRAGRLFGAEKSMAMRWRVVSMGRGRQPALFGGAVRWHARQALRRYRPSFIALTATSAVSAGVRRIEA